MTTTLAFIDQVGGWWNSLGLAQQFFYGLGLVAGLLAVILTVLSLIGMEHHDAIDAVDSAGLDHGGGGIFSIKPLTGFFLGFGWAGGIAMDNGASLGLALAIAVVAGVALMGLIVVMIRGILSLRSDGTVQIEQALGAVGTVYVTVPGAKGAGGQVVVNFSGRQETLAALTAGAAPIASGEKIKVVALIDSRTVLVEAL